MKFSDLPFKCSHIILMKVAKHLRHFPEALKTLRNFLVIPEVFQRPRSFLGINWTVLMFTELPWRALNFSKVLHLLLLGFKRFCCEQLASSQATYPEIIWSTIEISENHLRFLETRKSFHIVVQCYYYYQYKILTISNHSSELLQSFVNFRKYMELF